MFSDSPGNFFCSKFGSISPCCGQYCFSNSGWGVCHSQLGNNGQVALPESKAAPGVLETMTDICCIIYLGILRGILNKARFNLSGLGQVQSSELDPYHVKLSDFNTTHFFWFDDWMTSWFKKNGSSNLSEPPVPCIESRIFHAALQGSLMSPDEEQWALIWLYHQHKITAVPSLALEQCKGNDTWFIWCNCVKMII